MQTPGGVQLAALQPGKNDRNIMASGWTLRYTVEWCRLPCHKLVAGWPRGTSIRVTGWGQGECHDQTNRCVDRFCDSRNASRVCVAESSSGQQSRRCRHLERDDS